jgi:hypothetical protein
MPAVFVTAADLLDYSQELATLGAVSPAEAQQLRSANLEAIVANLLCLIPTELWIGILGLEGVAENYDPPTIPPSNPEEHS